MHDTLFNTKQRSPVAVGGVDINKKTIVYLAPRSATAMSSNVFVTVLAGFSSLEAVQVIFVDKVLYVLLNERGIDFEQVLELLLNLHVARSDNFDAKSSRRGRDGERELQTACP